MFRFTGLDVRLPTPDIGATLKFYRDALGMEVATLWPEESPRYLAIRCGGAHVAFYSDGGGSLKGSFVLGTENVLEVHERLTGLAPVVWGPEVYFYGRREFCVQDPAGHHVIFSEPTDEPPTCEG